MQSLAMGNGKWKIEMNILRSGHLTIEKGEQYQGNSNVPI